MPRRTITVCFPLSPPLSALYANVPGRGRVLSKRYKEWTSTCLQIVRDQMDDWQCLESPYTLLVSAERPPRRSDISNRLKAIEDLLVKAGIVLDDHLCHDIRIRWVPEVRYDLEMDFRGQLCSATIVSMDDRLV